VVSPVSYTQKEQIRTETQGMKSEKVNILMVDDQPGKLLSYEAILSELGENLIKATSGPEALEHLLKTDIGIVLMDVSMPGMDGFELAEIIRQHPRYQKTAMIFISAVHLTDLDQLKGYQRGAVDYLSVPVVPELLRAKVSVFAELHRKNKQLQSLNRELEQRVLERTEELKTRATALEHLNLELTRKNQELDAIVHTAPDIIFSRQADGARDYISDRFYEYTGAPAESGKGFGWLEYVHAEDRERCMAHWVRCVQSGENYESEYRMRSREGDYRWFRARAVPIRDDKGKIARWYGTCSDVHDSKVLEQSMRDNALKLERMVDERTADLRRVSGRLMTMQDEERRRFAREIHDGLGQELVAAKMVLDAMPVAKSSASEKQSRAEASQLIMRAIQQVRTISYLLHPPLLDEGGLVSAVRWYVDGLSKRSNIEISVNVDPLDFPRLSSEMETAIFRIIQEALTNVFRHSGAGKASVSLIQSESDLAIRICDDGKGISEQTEQLSPSGIGIGLSGMKHRVREFGGDLRITNSSPGAIVEVTIPNNSHSHWRRAEPCVTVSGAGKS
jgi:PAS domain S-box-containing protein